MSVLSAKATGKHRLERIAVTTGDGRTFDLGRPDSRLYPLRLRVYKFKRRHEIRAQKEV